MNTFYARPFELHQTYTLKIRDIYPSKSFMVLCEDGKYRAMTGNTSGRAWVDRNCNAIASINLYLDHPRALMLFRLENVQSIYFDRFLGNQNAREWVVEVSFTREGDDFYVNFPRGSIKLESAM